MTEMFSDFQAVKIEPVAEHSDLFTGALGPVDHQISNFYQWNGIKRFHYDKAFHSGVKDKENEHKVSLCLNGSSWLK